jgi:hypothetical protein
MANRFGAIQSVLLFDRELLALQSPSLITISDVNLLLFKDAANFRCKLIEQRSNRVIVQIARVERQHLASKNCNWFAVMGSIGV